MKVEKITRIPIREAFKFEYKHFTPWLCENIDVLGEAIGVELRNPEREQSTGNFNVDIKAEDGNGNTVVIENQYGSSNHDHLGKVITYLASFEAKIAIWIVEMPKQEHINAIAWLNEGENGCDFYLLKVEAIKIGESNPAPLLSIISGPSEESKQIGKIKKEQTHQDELRKSFWMLLLTKVNDVGIKLFTQSTVSGRDAWLAASAGVKGLSYVFWVNQTTTRIELRIDRGKGKDEENLEILNSFLSHKEQIEQAFGGELNWAELEGYRVCSIRLDIKNGGYKSSGEDWPEITEYVATSMAKLISATKPYLAGLNK